MTQRKLQIESLLKRTVSMVLSRDLSDPRVLGLLTVTKVDCSPDLRNATVYVTITPDKYEARSIAGLKHAVRYIQSLVKKRVALRIVPHLDFRLDKAVKKEAAVLAAIRRGIDASGPAPEEQATDAEGTEGRASDPRPETTDRDEG